MHEDIGSAPTWHSIPWLARFFNKSERHMRRWCVDGTFKAANMPTYRDKRGRWWVCLPPQGTIAYRTQHFDSSPSVNASSMRAAT